MALNIQSLKNVVLPRKRANPKGGSSTSTYNPQQVDQALTSQDFRAHLTDIFTDRISQDSRELLVDLFKYDSDISATLNAYLTIADTEPTFTVYNMEDELDTDGLKGLDQIIRGLTTRQDYSTGFKFTHKLEEIAEQLRYMILLRGGIATEMVFDKFLVPAEIRHIDLATVVWYEKLPGQYKPEQEPPNANDAILLDLPNVFVKHYRQNPSEIYTESPFVASINTVAARQQVINDLYRIMQKTGYPRMEITVVEEVLMKNAPASVTDDPNLLRTWMNARLQEIANGVSDLRPDAAYVHFDAVEASILNDGGPAKSLNASDIISVLNAQNQAALKTMGTIIGRGESGVNTASVEARVFSMSADSINVPIASMFEDMFTLALRLQGFDGYVKCKFAKAELRPDLELEPQRIMKQTRLHKDLSLGLIADAEYHMEMYGRPAPEGAPEISGTNFETGEAAADVESVSPNSDPLGRSVASSGSTKQARSKEVKK